jgi:hypothetical protein
MFHIKGDVNGVHNYPYKAALNPFMGILFVLGLTLCIKNWKKGYHLPFIGYFFLSLIPTILTYPWENPHMLRTITAVPSIIYFAGVAFLFLIDLSKKYQRILIAILLIGVVISSIYELRTYFVYQKEVLHDAFRNGHELPYYLNRNVHKL